MSFFFRTPTVDTSGYNLSQITDNAYVKITGFGHQNAPIETPLTLPVPVTGEGITNESTGHINYNGRPAPTLGGVKVSLEGEAASLRKCEGSFVCYTVQDFDRYHDAFLKPGCKIAVEYGYVNSSKTPTAKHEFIVYTFDFKLTKENYVECSFKAVGQGSSLEKMPVTAGTTAAAQASKDLEFITDYDGSNEKKKVGSFFDYLEYLIQKNTNSLNTSGFEPTQGKSWLNEDGRGGGAVLITPLRNSDPATDGGFFVDDRTSYLTLGFIVSQLNKWVSDSTTKTNASIQFVPSKPNLSLDVKGTPCKIFSNDPLQVGIVHADGGDGFTTPDVNHYGSLLWRLAQLRTKGTQRTVQAGGLHWHTIENTDAFFIEKGYENILISIPLLRKISNQFLRNTTPAQEGEQKEASFSVRSFLETLFAKVKTATAGHINLVLIDDPEKFNTVETIEEKEVLLIVNKTEGPGAEKPTPIVFDALNGDGLTKELTLTGKVPKAIQQSAFVGATGTSGDEGRSDAAFSGEEEDGEEIKGPATLDNRIRQAMSQFTTDGLDSTEAVQAATSVLEEMRKAVDTKDLVRSNFSVQYPLELGITLHGINGFRFGDLVTSNLLPAVYRDPRPNGLALGFTVTSIQQEIKDNQWTTSLGAVCRLYEK
jgi:hypothetical protein